MKLQYKLLHPIILMMFTSFGYAQTSLPEPVQACVLARDAALTTALRANIAQCLGWNISNTQPLCSGFYTPILITPLDDPEQIDAQADEVNFINDNKSPSTLKGNVKVAQGERIVFANTAYIYKNANNAVDKIVLLDAVRIVEPNRIILANKANINPQDKSGELEDVIYRFNFDRRAAILPAWGRASYIQRLPNTDYILKKATYTTCAPQDKAWHIEAQNIKVDNEKNKVVAKNAVFKIRNWPVFYSPYLSFPTKKIRKSGFLLPTGGYSSSEGFDLGLPYYINIAPNYDAIFVPHIYSQRGLMLGGNFRHLWQTGGGILDGNFLTKDKKYKNFLNQTRSELNQDFDAYPNIIDLPSNKNRWKIKAIENLAFSSNLRLNINYQQVSDDYYLQDFSSNLAITTERQLLKQIDLAYTTTHWLFKGLVQSYQTLNPINETFVSNIYERLPQLLAVGNYSDLPLDSNLNIVAQYDQFHWNPLSVFNPRILGLDPNFNALTQYEQNYLVDQTNLKPEGARFYLNPMFSRSTIKPWGYITPSVELVQNAYNIQWVPNLSLSDWNSNYSWKQSPLYPNKQISHSIPRFYVDSGLYFDKFSTIRGKPYRQTLEPRLFYLNVPYTNQTTTPVYDSAFMIFNYNQLFRTNRFSGFDRIGDTNQLSYALTTRFISELTGNERASFSIGQIQYFKDRRVTLCQSFSGYCEDNPFMLGYLPPNSRSSPIASRAVYNWNPVWTVTGDYVWDPATKATDNGQLNLHYQPAPNEIIQFGYTYLVNGDITLVAGSGILNNALHQATVSYAWPLTDKWSTLGVYSYNISKKYSMLGLFGVQYDSCCWALRLFGGQTFTSLTPQSRPQYNKNIYLQILFKGVGSVENLDPTTTINTYIWGYKDPFQY